MSALPFTVTGTISDVRGDLLDISQFGDDRASRHVIGAIDVSVTTRAGSIPIPWVGGQPKVGDRVKITVEAAP